MMYEYVKTTIGNTEFDTIQRNSMTNNGVGNIPLAPVAEYVFLYANNLNRNQTKVFDLSSLVSEIKLDSIWIDSAETDQFEFEVLNESDRVITRFRVRRGETPLSFPTAILTPERKIRIKALSDIAEIRIYAVPVKIIQVIVAE